MLILMCRQNSQMELTTLKTMLKKSFQEIYRVLKPNGIAIIVYAHKSTEGWETLINSLLDSGLIMTGAWPLDTENKSRLRAQESATLASSIYIVARKMEREPTGFYNEVKAEMTTHLNTKLHRLWEEGIGGADFFIAAIGSAIEVFGKYEKVMDFEGEIIRADRLLDDVREIATDYAVRQILHNGFAGEISDLPVSTSSGGGSTGRHASILTKRESWRSPVGLTSPKNGMERVLSSKRRRLSASSVHRPGK